MLLLPAMPSHINALCQAGAAGFAGGQVDYAVWLIQLVISEPAYSVFAAVDDAVPVAMAGLAPLPGGDRELWFCAADRQWLARRMPAVAALARSVLRREAGVVVYVRRDNAEGQRLARCLGFWRTRRELRGHDEWRR